MAKRRYEPPKQSGIGQFIDSMLLLVLVYASLMLPLLIELGGGGESESAAQTPQTWEALGQNPTMQAQWEKLGIGIDDAAAMINDKFDYTIDPLMLIITAAVIVGYFVFLLVVSDREYREVIAEKFGEK